MRTQRDPIEGARHVLEALGVEEAELKQIDDEVKAQRAGGGRFRPEQPGAGPNANCGPTCWWRAERCPPRS